MKLQQQVLTGKKIFESRNMSRVKAGTVKFYPPTYETADSILEDTENIFHRTELFALTSGGGDSISLCHWLAKKGKLKSAVHIKTNIGFQATTDFVIDYCNEMSWPLIVIEPNPKFAYAAHVFQYGFPGPEFHRQIMGRLKYKTMRDFALTINKKEHCLVSGVRKFESNRRKGNFLHPIQSEGSLWFTSPFFYKRDEEIYKYRLVNNLKITPIHKLLGYSGECMCGSYAGINEKELIRKIEPKLADYIDYLEDGVQRFGTKEAKRYPTWGGASSMSELERQLQIDSFFLENPKLKNVNELEEIICGTECGPGTMRAMENY